ncbi:MAG: hypothetical protein AAGG11_21200 [Pseudomonadota bacterium]
MSYCYEMSSTIPGVSAKRVWDRIGTWEGVNDELGPLVQMFVPAEYPRVGDIPADGRYHFASKILLLGVLPIDSHQFGLRAIEPPRYFDERSENRMMRRWSHRRTVTATEDGARVTDQCSFEPRSALLGGLLLWIYRFIFRRRHRRLVRYFANA